MSEILKEQNGKAKAVIERISADTAIMFAEKLGIEVSCERDGRDSIMISGQRSEISMLITEIRCQGTPVKVVSMA